MKNTLILHEDEVLRLFNMIPLWYQAPGLNMFAKLQAIPLQAAAKPIDYLINLKQLDRNISYNESGITLAVAQAHIQKGFSS